MMKGAASATPLTEAPTVNAAEGYVLVDHPAGLALTLTPPAAKATAQRLIAAAEEASFQQTLGAVDKGSSGQEGPDNDSQ